MGDRALADRAQICPDLVLAAVRGWIGTPYLRRAAMRGVGADCVGLIRGVIADVTGAEIVPPRWSVDPAALAAEPVMAAARDHLLPLPLAAAAPGHVVAYRTAAAMFAHVGILTPGGVIHCSEVGGVREVADLGRAMTAVWAIPAPADCETAPSADGILGVLYPEAGRWRVAFSDAMTATPLGCGPLFASRTAALDHAGRIADHLESME